MSRFFHFGDYTDCATTRGGGVHAIENESTHTPQLEQGQGVGQAVQSGKAAGSRWIDASGFAFNQGQHANNYQGRWEEGDQPGNRHKGRQRKGGSPHQRHLTSGAAGGGNSLPSGTRASWSVLPGRRGQPTQAATAETDGKGQGRSAMRSQNARKKKRHTQRGGVKRGAGPTGSSRRAADSSEKPSRTCAGRS